MKRSWGAEAGDENTISVVDFSYLFLFQEDYLTTVLFFIQRTTAINNNNNLNQNFLYRCSIHFIKSERTLKVQHKYVTPRKPISTNTYHATQSPRSHLHLSLLGTIPLAMIWCCYLLCYAISVRCRRRGRIGDVNSSEHDDDGEQANTITKKKDDKHRRRQALLEIFQEQKILKVRVHTYILLSTP